MQKVGLLGCWEMQQIGVILVKFTFTQVINCHEIGRYLNGFQSADWLS